MKSRSIFHMLALFSLLLSILSSTLTVTPVHAASFSVGDAPSLISAINTANTNNSDDVIILTANITLTIIDNAQNGLPIILADGGNSLTIEGAGFTISRFSGAPDFRILQIGAGANVTINDLTISGGSNVAGAGIHMQTGSTVILDNVEVLGNNNPTGRGGGIYNYYSTLTIQNGSIIGNSSAPNTGCQGGGIFSEGIAPNSAVTLLDASTVSYNQSPNCPGGGIFLLSDSNLTIQNGSVVSNNLGGDPGTYPPFTDPAGGGGIFASSSPTITITDSTVSNNTVNCVGNPNCGGGGLKGGSTVTITNSTFSNNTVNCNTSSPCGGGGIYNQATLNITNSTFSGNTATNDGGGIYNHATLNITNSTFSGNSATNGGGINNQSSLTIANSTLSSNSATNGGGGIYNINTVISTNNTLSSNIASIVGGGIFNANTITLTNNTLSANSASAAGAGMYNASGATMNYSNTIIANSLSSGGDCISIGSIGTNTNNVVEDGGCFPSLTLDPRLNPLANNGGFTQTHALQTSPIVSPAIDAGANCPATDQRGASRPNGIQCDIGAFEKIVDATFMDVPNTAFAWANIESIYIFGITSGCSLSPLNYCPDVPVTRAQMAIFILKGIHGASYTPAPATGTVFIDVTTSHWASAWIEQFYNEGITVGCGGGNFCPDSIETTRAQIAIFLLKAKHGSSYIPPPATGTMFNDVAINSFAAAWIEQLATEGITGGCGSGNYCPNQSVTRAQMAIFIQRTFNLPLP